MLPPLTKDQLILKRKINRRHTENKPSLIGCSSPCDIEKMIKRKAARVKTQTEEEKFPLLEIYCSRSEKKRSHSPTAFSPLTIVEGPEKRFTTENNEIEI